VKDYSWERLIPLYEQAYELAISRFAGRAAPGLL